VRNRNDSELVGDLDEHKISYAWLLSWDITDIDPVHPHYRISRVKESVTRLPPSSTAISSMRATQVTLACRNPTVGVYFETPVGKNLSAPQNRGINKEVLLIGDGYKRVLEYDMTTN